MLDRTRAIAYYHSIFCNGMQMTVPCRVS